MEARILESIQYSNWIAPTVPVLNKDLKTVHIRGDFKMTVNKVTHLDCHLIPRVEDLLAKVENGSPL